MSGGWWRCWGLVAVVVAVLAAWGGPGVEALKCYKCNNCIKYEESQSQTCSSEHTRCMKMSMETGQVQRGCGTPDMCTNSETELKTRYTAVHCCEEDNCNSSPTLAPVSLLLLLLPPALALARPLMLSC